MDNQNRKSHRERKNGRAHDLYLERNKARNKARGLQHFVWTLGWLRGEAWEMFLLDQATLPRVAV